MKILINPDIHGRVFWKYSIEHKDEFDKIIFLGDYLDAYSPDLLVNEKDNFKEIIQFKKDNPDKVILLLGNHDCHYINSKILHSSRYNPFKASIYHKLFNDNLDLFQLVYIYNKYLFSHAGVYQKWMDLNKLTLKDLLDCDLDKLSKSLNWIDYFRGGFYDVGSCIWADIRDSGTEKLLKGYYHIFGHTQLKFNLSTSELSCLDCRIPFSLDSETGHINKLMDIPSE